VLNRLLDTLHGRSVFPRRVEVLTAALADLMPRGARVLDVGAGDGTIGQRIMQRRSDVHFEGVDVMVRPHTAYPVRAFDGEHLPFDDDSHDVALFVDVLHHTRDPAALLREAARVAPVVIIKDHLREGLLAEETLTFMDWVGNARHGVVLPYNYLNRLQWRAAIAQAGLVVDEWGEQVGLYPWPASHVFDRQLHVIARLRRGP
jgi:SAM-dependent methyltransferase